MKNDRASRNQVSVVRFELLVDENGEIADVAWPHIGNLIPGRYSFIAHCPRRSVEPPTDLEVNLGATVFPVDEGEQLRPLENLKRNQYGECEKHGTVFPEGEGCAVCADPVLPPLPKPMTVPSGTREIDLTHLVRCVCDEPLLPKSPPRSGIEGDPVRCVNCGRVFDPEKVVAIEQAADLACACGAAGQELHEPDCEVGYPTAANADPDPLPPGQDFRRFEKVPGEPGFRDRAGAIPQGTGDRCSVCFNFVPPVGQRTAECPSCGALYEEHPVRPWSAKAAAAYNHCAKHGTTFDDECSVCVRESKP